jgi:hypothetical protein
MLYTEFEDTIAASEVFRYYHNAVHGTRRFERGASSAAREKHGALQRVLS